MPTEVLLLEISNLFGHTMQDRFTRDLILNLLSDAGVEELQEAKKIIIKNKEKS